MSGTGVLRPPPAADRLRAWRRRWPDAAGLLLLLLPLLLWTALAYRAAHENHFAVRADPANPIWWRWADQGRYLRAAVAWAHGSLDPAQHWYFAGYPLLGALFVRLTPGRPFYLVDMGCLLLVGALLPLLARALLPAARWAAALGAAAFAVTVLLTPFMMKSFVEPWTTTPTAVLSLLSFPLAFRLWRRPAPGRAALLGLAAAAIVPFRPTDALPLGLALAACTAVALRGLGARALARLALAGLAGAAIPLGATAASYVAVFGFHRSAYLLQSAQTGFEWRLIPLHWVTLFVSPQTLFPGEYSLAQRFPWIAPGIAGMAACLVASAGQARLRHALVVSAVALHCLLYLAYRDLHPQGLFRFGNYHYFKWVVPVFGLYALFLPFAVFREPRRLPAWAAGLATVTLLFCWRAPWRDASPGWASPATEAGHTLTIPAAPRTVEDGVFVPAAGGFAETYLTSQTMRIGDETFPSNTDWKSFPVPGGIVVMPLRPLPPGPATITFDPGIQLLPGPVRPLRARIAWRWPHPGAILHAYIARWHTDD